MIQATNSDLDNAFYRRKRTLVAFRQPVTEKLDGRFGILALRLQKLQFFLSPVRVVVEIEKSNVFGDFRRNWDFARLRLSIDVRKESSRTPLIVTILAPLDREIRHDNGGQYLTLIRHTSLKGSLARR